MVRNYFENLDFLEIFRDKRNFRKNKRTKGFFREKRGPIIFVGILRGGGARLLFDQEKGGEDFFSDELSKT